MKSIRELKSTYIERIAIADILSIIFGSLLLGAAIQSILVPAHLLNGGISGLAILLKLISGLDVWIWYALLNVPIFIAGYKYVNRRFIIYSLIGTIALSIFLGIFKSFQFTLDDTLLVSLFGGALAGMGSGLIFRGKGSSGGLDIIAVIIRHRWGFSIGQTFFTVNLIIISCLLLLTNIRLTLFSILTIFISSQVVDRVLLGPEVTRTALVITGKHEEISTAILNTLHRGCTLLSGTGGFSGGEHKVILTTVGKIQLPRLKDIVLNIDPRAFMIINETIEVYGKGFKSGENLP